MANAPCSWGVEFADDPRNPPWAQVVKQCAQAGYSGIELGPVGYMPEAPNVLTPALESVGLTLVGGVVFRPFHDPNGWPELRDAARRTCAVLSALGAEHLVLIDSISSRRAATAGRPNEADQMDEVDWSHFVERIRTIARMGSDEYGLTTSVHPHAGGFIDFLPEVERLLDETDPRQLRLCIDTGHCVYAGFDPLAFMVRHADRLSYVHFKTTDPQVKARVIKQRIGFYDACAQGLFCDLSDGEIDFRSVRELLERIGYSGWCTVEQDCDPAGETNPFAAAKANRDYLETIGFVSKEN
ncbi:MAG: TIM barrel protein [Salinisphaera sp.]|nr:TIM barrel protein [Salinisphaera sp.]